MIIKLREQKGCIIAEFNEFKSFTLAISEEVKTELKPILLKENTHLIFDLQPINFIDSTGIGCLISLMKAAKSNNSYFKICNVSDEVMEVIELVNLSLIFDIEKDVDSCIKNFEIR